MSASRRSMLQIKILIQLDERPAKTITELSERVKSQRPSVSRSLQILKKHDLVTRAHNGWLLTDAGRLEAREGKIMVEKIAETARSVVAGSNLMMSDLSKSILASVPVFDTSSLVAPYLDTLSDLSASMRSPLVDVANGILSSMDLATQVSAAMAPILDANRHNLTLMGEVLQFKAPSYFEEFTRENNALFAHITDNLLEMRQLSIAELVPDYSELILKTTRINTALDDIWRQSIKDMVSPMRLPAEVLSMEVTLPTQTVAHYTDAVIVHMKKETEDGSSGRYEIREDFGDDTLDPLLAKLNPDFVEMRRGSWSALAAKGYDRLRHAATSQRELVRQVLQLLIPDAQLPEELEKGKPHIKARVKAALGGSRGNAEFVISVSEAVFNLYNQHNKFTHHNEKHEAELRAILRTGEGLLAYLLSAIEL